MFLYYSMGFKAASALDFIEEHLPFLYGSAINKSSSIMEDIEA
jgi:hypothetical protein